MIENMISIKGEKLQEFIINTFTKAGLPKSQAEIASKHMVYADIRGIDTHGVIRLPIYIKRIKKDLIKANANYKWENETDNTVVLDADDGIGHYSAHIAMEKAIEKAKNNTIGMVFVKNGSHYGAAGCYSSMAAEQGFIGFTTTNTVSLMAPSGGAERVLGNNPLSFAVPREDADPILLDIACSTVAAGKLMLAEQKGESIPETWAVDKNGKPTTDPRAGFAEGGSLLPVGNHKGYGLALIMDILAGVLSGASYGKKVNSLYNLNTTESLGLGFVMMAINIDKILPKAIFNTRLEDLVSMIIDSEKAEGTNRIYLPGEIEQTVKADRKETGIPINGNLYSELKELSRELGIPFNL
jgi:LDH2 family malate/lactate/ureidoglycolate dehydrogenase